MPSAPQDSLESVLTTARVRLNDAIASIGGEILTDVQPFTLVMVNAGWRRLQQLLVDLGFAALKSRSILTPVPASTNLDPGSLQAISWTGFDDATAVQSAPVLPQDLISPLKLAERVTGSGAVFTPMDLCLNGIPTVVKGGLNKLWEWRTSPTFAGQQTINLPGATGRTDLLMLYAAFLPDFVPSSTTAFASQPVQIMRALSPFADFICVECAKARGDLDAGSFDVSAIQETQQIFNRDLAQPRSLYKPSEAQKMRDPRSPSDAPNPRNPTP